MVKSPFCGADEARARASAGISRNPRYPPPPKAAAPSGGGCRSFETSAKQETESRSKDLNSVSAVRTRLELATPGVTGRYSKPTELPHQLSVNFPFGIAKVQLKFDSANILKDFNEKNVRPRGDGHFQRVCGRGRSLEREGCFTTTGRVAAPRREVCRSLEGEGCRTSQGGAPNPLKEAYWTSICRWTFSGSTFLTLAMVTVRTPCSTLAAMSSRFASSGRSIVCWNLV